MRLDGAAAAKLFMLTRFGLLEHMHLSRCITVGICTAQHVETREPLSVPEVERHKQCMLHQHARTWHDVEDGKMSKFDAT